MSSNFIADVELVSVGVGLSPDSYTQQEILDAFAVEDERVRSMFHSGGIERRHLTLPAVQADGGRAVESQGDLLRKHLRVGMEMGTAALEDCLKNASATVEDISYLCCVTSTGFLTPGFSALLVKELGLRRDCARLDVVGMGCNAGLNALNTAVGWANTNPGELGVVVCIETCSAAYVFDGTMGTAVVNSLFGDGAAAVAVRADGTRGTGPVVRRFASRIIPEAVDAMRYDWDEDAGRFSFRLHADIPFVIGANAGPALDALLSGTGLTLRDIDHWVVHSGGRKVIEAVRLNLGLTRHEVRHTTGVLRDHGNLSSGSFLFSLKRLQDEGFPMAGDNGVLMTMGPGSTIELVLVRW